MVAMARAAVCVWLWLAVSRVGGSYVPKEMNRTIQDLLQHYRVPRNVSFGGSPVFTKEAKDAPSGKMEVKMLLMGGVLDTYERMIGHMMTQHTDKTNKRPGGGADDITRQLRYILTKVQELKRHRYKEQENLLHEIRALRHVKMDDLVVQNKALRELLPLYEEASSLPNAIQRMEMRRRRRRQAQRAKSPLRG